MQRPRKAAFIIFALATSVTALASEYKPGEVIVKYRDGIWRARSETNAMYDSVGVNRVQHYSGILKGIEHLVLKDGVTVQDAIKNLKKNITVEYAQPNYILHALPIRIQSELTVTAHVNDDENVPCLIPGIPFPPGCEDPDNGDDPERDDHAALPSSTRPALKAPPEDVVPPVADPSLAQAYGLSKVGAPQAWEITRGSKDFVVADIDTGIDYNHADLAFNVWRNPSPSNKNDIVGFDFIHNDGLPYDDNNHGSHTAGTIGAVGGNGIGVSGVTQRVSLMALKFLSSDGSGTTADAVRAIDYAVSHGAKVLSNSWGGHGDPDNQVLREAITRAQQKGVLFIAAAGNDGTDNDGSDPAYPAAFDNDNIITVAATNEKDVLASFSNYGQKTTHVAAPGSKVYSTVPGNQYKTMSGTSMACPHVAGAAALLWSKHPEWDYKKVKEVLMNTVDLLPSLANRTVTGGRINVFKALQSAESL